MKIRPVMIMRRRIHLFCKISGAFLLSFWSCNVHCSASCIEWYCFLLLVSSFMAKYQFWQLLSRRTVAAIYIWYILILWICLITFPWVDFTRASFDIIFHIRPIPDISIIFCRREGTVGAGVPRGWEQLIKVLRKETGPSPSEAPWGRNNNFVPASYNLVDFLIGGF